MYFKVLQGMSKVSKLFNFMSGLQGLAQTELRRQGVQDLPSTMAATDCLFDYKITSSPTPTQKGKVQKQESSRKLESKTFKKNEGKEWKKLDVYAKVGERLPHKLPDHQDVLSAIGHIERGIAQGRKRSM